MSRKWSVSAGNGGYGMPCPYDSTHALTSIMGIELELQAIPENSLLFQRAREDAGIYGLLQFFGYYSRLPSQKFDVIAKHRHGRDAEFDEFVALLRDAWDQNPGLAQRQVYLDRRWHILQVTLSNANGDQEWINIALYGGPPLWSMQEADTQNPLGLLPSSEVREVAPMLAALDLARLEKQWNPSALREAGVYKAYHLDDSDWHWVQQDLLNLQSFYSQAVTHGEAVLCVRS